MSVGIDIVEIKRIEKSIQNKAFLDKCFSKDEQDYFKSRNFAPQTVAANFAAKEAFSKAIKTGVSGFRLQDIEVLRDINGAPFIVLSGLAKEIAKEMNLGEISVSLSHDGGMAIAVVQIEKNL